MKVLVLIQENAGIFPVLPSVGGGFGNSETALFVMVKVGLAAPQAGLVFPKRVRQLARSWRPAGSLPRNF